MDESDEEKQPKETEVERQVVFNTEEGHNKFYIVIIKKVGRGKKYKVEAYWGRAERPKHVFDNEDPHDFWNAVNQWSTKGEYDNLESARFEVEKIILSKIRKGHARSKNYKEWAN